MGTHASGFVVASTKMSVTPLEAYEIAILVAAEAAQLLEGAQDDIGKIRSKSNARDLVTQWDTRCEELILRRLSKLTPSIPILAEESGQHGDSNTKTRWLVDPIDGTVNFAHGVPYFGICISLEQDDKPVAAVVEAPAMGWTFAAYLGNGATLNGKAISVSHCTSLDQAMLASGFPYDRATTGHNFAQWEHFQRTASACRRFGAASIDLCMVAKGAIDGYWETRLSPWDLSAGALLVTEAGGQVTGVIGEPFSSREGHAVASNGGIHKEILSELARVGLPPL